MLATVENVLEDLPSTTVLIQIQDKMRWRIKTKIEMKINKNNLLFQIFEVIEKEISMAIKKRYHSCVLAYGQSSTGKTHTMMGCLEDPGITPRLCNKIFDYIQEAVVGEEQELSMKTCVRYL